MEVKDLQRDVVRLLRDLEHEAQARTSTWLPTCPRAAFRPSAGNLALYLALRQRDLRPLQQQLMRLGLSSLDGIEGRVAPALHALLAALSAVAGRDSPVPFPDERAFHAGELQLAANAEEIFGQTDGMRLMVTAPAEAASSPAFAKHLLSRGVQALRINCAHDDEAIWRRMVAHAHMAEVSVGRRLRIFMDLAGPKIRTADVLAADPAHEDARLNVGDRIALTRAGHAPGSLPSGHTAIASCTLEAPLLAAEPDHRVFYDDGKVCATVERRADWGLLLRLTQAPTNGVRLKPEKGLNFPDTPFATPALTDKDRRDLAFVAAHADGVGFSFVQSPDDLAALEDALGSCERPLPAPLSLILKIETRSSLRQLPDLIVHAAARRPTAVMIARGDLAVEIGFARTAEMQEEMLWLCEAAHVPVVWATQVLETFIKKRKHSRGEMTDAAMGARAECLMLNKGPHLLPAIDILRQLLPRMAGHLHKKTPQFRPLQTWQTACRASTDAAPLQPAA